MDTQSKGDKVHTFTKTIVDVATGETTILPFTEEETAAHLAEQKKIADSEAALVAENKAKAEAKANAETKLVALGLNLDDLRALGL